MTLHKKRCPICNIKLSAQGNEAQDHLIEQHPLFKPRDMELGEYWLVYVLEYEKHLIRVLNGEENLDPKYEKYIVRSASDYVRYTAQSLSFRKKKIVTNTEISSPVSRSNNITYATSKKRNP